VGDEVLDRGVLAEGEPGIALGGVEDRAQVEPRVDRLDDLLAADEVVEDVGVRRAPRADLGDRAEQPAAAEPTSSERIEKAVVEWYWSAARSQR
jgi:hypothetical protein